MSGSDIADHLGIGRSIVNRYIRKHNIGPSKDQIYKWRGEKLHKPMTKSEKRYIKNNIAHQSIKTIAKALHRTANYVSAVAKEMGFEALIQEKQLNSFFQKGMIPVNKGMKQSEYMSAEAISKSLRSRFQKGNIPHNTKPRDGVISIRTDHVNRKGKQYKWIRLAPGKWELYHKYLWEVKNGKVPKGHCLWFKDGNPLNCKLSNLELITRKENYLRNSGSLNLTDAYVAHAIAGKNKSIKAEIAADKNLIAIKRTQLQLRRKIKQHEQ
jgi:predicted transcriptional regulator